MKMPAILKKIFHRETTLASVPAPIVKKPRLAEVITFPPPPPKPVVMKNTLTLILRDSTTSWFTRSPWDESDPPNDAWNEFIDWYFDTDTDKDDSFMFHHSTGSTTFRRDDILRFSVRIEKA